MSFLTSLTSRFTTLLDSTTIHTTPRYITLLVLLTLFTWRILHYQGYYIVAYALAIYILNIFLAFITPKFDPAGNELGNTSELASESQGLPMNIGGEFKPFIRRLPEFQFCAISKIAMHEMQTMKHEGYSAIRATVLSLIASFIPAFDVPVFWPILLVYFFILFFLTMRRQLQHMMKHKYVPWDFGKKKFSKGAKPAI